MACGNLPKRTCLVLSGLGIQCPNHTVYSHVFEDALDHLVVHGLREAWQQGFIEVGVTRKYVLGLLVERNTHRTGVFVLGLLRDILNAPIDEVCLGQRVKVTHTASYQTLEHEHVTIYGIARVKCAKVGIINLVTLLQVQEKRIAVHWLGYLVLVKGIVLGHTLLDAPFDDGADSVEAACDAVLGTFSLVLALGDVPVKKRELLAIGVFLLHPSLQVAQVICCYRVNVELKSTAVHHFPLESLVPANLVYVGKVVLAAVRCQYGLVNIVL